MKLALWIVVLCIFQELHGVLHRLVHMKGTSHTGEDYSGKSLLPNRHWKCGDNLNIYLSQREVESGTLILHAPRCSIKYKMKGPILYMRGAPPVSVLHTSSNRTVSSKSTGTLVFRSFNYTQYVPIRRR